MRFNDSYIDLWNKNWPVGSHVYVLDASNDPIETRISSEMMESLNDGRLYVKVYGINDFIPISRIIPKNRME